MKSNTTVCINKTKYLLESEITCGSQGVVYNAVNLETEESVVVKMIDLTNNDKRRFYKIETTAILDIEPWNYEYLVNYILFCDEGKYGFIVMEKYDGDLFDFIIGKKDPISEELAKCIFQKICTGLRNMHSCWVAHLDIKLENIMFDVDTMIPYIGDFGACYYFKNFKKCSSARGTDVYSPPEYAKRYSFDPRKSDIYSLGVTLHAMLTKVYPYDINKELGKRKIIIDDNLSDECKNLLKKMLKTNPKKRISLDEIMKHPWITNIKKESKLQKLTSSVNKCVDGLLGL